MLFFSFEHDLCDGVFGCVRHGEVSGARAGLFVEFAHAAMKEQDWRSRLARGDFDVLPGDAAGPTRLQGFERGLFGGKTRSVMHGRDRAATVAIGALAFRVNALDETRRARDDFAQATNFDDVYAD